MPIEEASSPGAPETLSPIPAPNVARKRSATSPDSMDHNPWIQASMDTAVFDRMPGHKAVRPIVVADAAPMDDDSSSVDSSNAQNHVDLYLSPKERYMGFQTLRDSLFGKVVLATDSLSGFPVAIKISQMHLLNEGKTIHGGKVIENPIAEAVMMRLVGEHPHVISLLDEHYDDGLHWMAMEFAPNGEFFDFVCRAGHLDDNTARFFFLQMVSALKHLHDRNICHMDFSLENLLMDANHNLKLCDFGVARVVPADGSRFPGIRKEKPGKLRYMAPEVLAGLPFHGKAADMFSLGVTLYSMLTGNAPFECANMKDKRYQYILANRLREMLNILHLSHRVSNEALSLLQGLLCPEESRLTIDQVLAHPWVQRALQSTPQAA